MKKLVAAGVLSLAAVAGTGNTELMAKAAEEVDGLKRRIYQILAES